MRWQDTFKQSRKAQMGGPLISDVKKYLIALIVGVVLIAFVTITLLDKINQTSINEACRLSIVAADGVSKAEKLGVISLADKIHCPKREIRIKSNDISRGSSLSPLRLNSILTNEMKSCIMKTGKGDLNPFKSLEEGGARYCIVCSEITFDERIQSEQAKGNFVPKGFNIHMATEPIGSSGQTLYEFVTETEVTDAVLNAMRKQNDEDVITTFIPYSIVFRVENRIDDSIVENIKTTTATALGGTGGVVGGAVTTGLAFGTIALTVGLIAAPFTGGLSLAAVAGILSTTMTATVIGAKIGAVAGATVGAFGGYAGYTLLSEYDGDVSLIHYELVPSAFLTKKFPDPYDSGADDKRYCDILVN